MPDLETYIPPIHANLSKIEAINQKRTLAFINHWVLHTVAFLNQFASVCEDRLSAINTKIRRAGDSLALLEDKLSSIPGLEIEEKIISKQAEKLIEASTTQTTNNPVDVADSVEEQAPPVEKPTEIIEETVISDVIPIKSDPLYAKYFKMMSFGVPEPAVKMKMSAEGLDPSLLNNPEAPAPTASYPAVGEDVDSSDTLSSWSDS